MRSQSETVKDYETAGCLVINLAAAGSISKEQKGLLIEAILLALELSRHPLIYNVMMQCVHDRLDEVMRQTQV